MADVYRWKTGARAPVPAQVVGEVCEKLESKGRLTPKNLVDISRPEDAPLHGAFEWNDTVAAEMYREQQGRYLIRSIEVVRTNDEPIRAFFTLKRTAKEHEYHSIDAVMRNKDDAAQLLEQAKSELVAFKRKYVQLSNELAGVFREIDALEVA